MKSRALFPLVILSLALIAVGCGSDAAQPEEAAPTDEPAIIVEEPATEEPVAVAEPVTIRVGVQTDSVPPLTIVENGAYSGFEIDLAAEIVSRIYGSEASIEWVPITSQERFTSLAEDQVDMLVRNVLHTLGREESALFSGGYLLYGNGFLVFRDAGYATSADLDGEKVAVLSFMQESLNTTVAGLGFTVVPFVVENDDAAYQAFLSGQAKAIYHDWVLLAGLMDSTANSLFLDDAQLAPFGIAFPLDEQDFRDKVDIALGEMISDGTWQSLFDKWFGLDVPWNVDEMLDTPPG